MSDTQDTKDQVAPSTPHKKNEICITIADIHPAALKAMCQKHNSLPDSQTHPQAAKETEDMNSAKNPTKNVIFKETITIDQPDQKETQLLQQTPTDTSRSVAVAAHPSNTIDEEEQNIIRQYKEAMNLKNQKNMESLESFNRSPDSDCD